MDRSPTLVPQRCNGLVAKINSGECVLVLGPRVGVPAAVSPDQAPVAVYLERKLREDLRDSTVPASTLRETAARYEQRKSAAMLRGVYQQFVSELDGQTTDLHRDLATLPFKLVLMATPDRMMFQAFRDVGKTGVREAYYDYSAATSDEWMSLPSEREPVVYSLFGRYDHPESMMLTDANLLDYLVCITRETPKLPDPVRATLRAPSTSFLFVGFGFTSWWLRLFLKVLDVTGNQRRLLSLAFEDTGSFDQAAREQNSDFFESAGIYIQAGDWGALAKELVATYRAKTTQQTAPQGPRAGDAAAKMQPLVFLSYASEDRDKVVELGKGLEARGVTVWQDVQDLRVGESWESQIVKYIKKTDFFVFIQSPQMDQRDARAEGGVYNKELARAIERAEEFPRGRAFVFYVAFGDCPVRADLSALQRQRVDTPDGVTALAAALVEAFAPIAAARAVSALQLTP